MTPCRPSPHRPWHWLLALAIGVLAALGAAAATTARLDRPDALVVVSDVEQVDPDGTVKPVQLFDEAQSQPGQPYVERRYRFDLDVPASRSGWALYLSGAIGHVSIVLNGQPLIDTITDPPGPAPRGINLLRLIDLPPHLLRSEGNRVEITLRGKSWVSLSRVTLGPQQALRDLRDRKAFLMVYGPVVVSAVIGCLGLSVLLIWLRRPSDTIYGWFGVASLAWGLHTAWGAAPRTFVSPQHFYVWYGSLYFFLVITLTVFALRFAGYAWRRFERVVLGAAALMPALYYTAQAFGVLSTLDMLVRLIMVLNAFIALLAVARSAWFRRSTESSLLVMAGIAAAGLGLRDWLVFTFQDDNLPVQLAPYAGLPFVALVAWFLIDRFVRTNESLELLNRELEQRVQAKSAELLTALDHMRAARDWAETANRAKTGFLAAASHDLRQPIHALGLYMAALRGRPLDDAAQDIVRRMDGSVAALDSLFNALLDVSRMDAGTVVPQAHAFDIARLVHRLADDMASEAAQRGLRFSARVGAAPRHVAWADPVLLERVLRNLIANALKYTSAGGVLVSCRARGGPQGVWRVEVWDSGPGIPEHERDRVFDEFYQGGNPERDRRSGLGLGLAIVRRLTRLMQLPLGLHSRVGHGTRFVLDVPASEQPVEEVTQAEVQGPLSGLVVAVIEDDVEVRDAMVTLLRGWGCVALTGSDSDELLMHAAARALTAHAVVADLRLRAGRDGLQAVAALREQWGAALPALVVTGDSAPDRVRLLQDSGLPWLAKPVPAARLRSWLMTVAGGVRGLGQSPRPSENVA
jgi:signal transduction histidine kinase/CheY-like chemotaxis protein